MEQPIEAAVGLRAPMGRVREVLADVPGVLAAAEPTRDERRARTFTTALAVSLGAGGRVEQEVVLHVGLPVSTPQSFMLPIHWEPTGHQHLLPSFDGALVATEGRPGTQLTLRGHYTIPLGLIGRLGDAVAGRRLAGKVIGAYLDDVRDRVEAEVAVRAAAPVPVRGPASVNAMGSEYFIG